MGPDFTREKQMERRVPDGLKSDSSPCDAAILGAASGSPFPGTAEVKTSEEDSNGLLRIEEESVADRCLRSDEGGGAVPSPQRDAR